MRTGKTGQEVVQVSQIFINLYIYLLNKDVEIQTKGYQITGGKKQYKS